MADAQYGEGRQFNLHSAGTDLVEGSALAIKGGSGAITVDGKTVGSVNALYVAIADASGNQITSFGGGTQYAEDVALGAVGSATGTISAGRASASAPTAVSADNDAAALWVSRFGALNVILRDTSGNALATGSQYTEDSAITANAGVGTLVVARRDDALAALTPVEDDAVGIRVNNRGALWVSIADGSGNQITSFGGGTQYAEDAAFGGNGTGTLMIARRDDSLATLTPVEDDAVGLRTNSRGALWVAVDGSLGATAGDVAHDAVDSGNPVKIGGKAITATPTAVAALDRVDGWFDLRGSQATFLTDANGNKLTWATDSMGDGHVDGAAYLSIGGSGRPVGVHGAGFNGSTWDKNRTFNAYTTAASTPEVGILAAGQPDKRYTSVSLQLALNSTQAWDAMAADAFMFHIGTTTTGAITFEVSADGTNFVSAEARDVALDLWVTGTGVTPTSGKVYRVITNGWRSVRVRTSSAMGANVSIIATASARSTIVSALDTGPAPHAFGYSLTGKTAQYTTTQTGAALWTPASGKRLVITSVQIQTGGTTAGTVQLWFGASADTTYTRGTDLAIFDGEFLPDATRKPGVVMTGPFIASAADHVLRVTDSAAINPLTITVWGYEA